MHYAIIGNGVAGTTAALALRKRDEQATITLIGGESDYFFSRTALMYAFMDRMTTRDLEPFERKTYDKLRITRRHGWVTDLDADSQILTFKNGPPLPYHRLLLATGSAPNRPAWPGLDAVKEGATHFVSLQDLAECERLTPSTKRAVVVGGGLIGVELAECLAHHGVAVDFLVREPWYWPAALSAEEGALVAEEVARHRVKLRLDEEVAAVQSDPGGRVSGIRTGKGEEIPCRMLGMCIGVRPSIDWLKKTKTPPALGRGIQVSPDFSTTLPNVWSAGDCAEFPHLGGLVEQIWYSAKRQGELAARAMLGDSVDYRPPLFHNSAKFFELEYTTAGQMRGASFFWRAPGRRASIRISHESGAVTGFSMLGSRWDHTRFETWIHERRSLDYVLANLRQAQFDVEFGRLPLGPLPTDALEKRA